MRLASGEVHCWSVRLDIAPETVASLTLLLSDDERRRSTRLRSYRLRRRYIAAHAGVRVLLAQYLGARPDRLRFVRNAFGKPALSGACGRRLTFNLSHSEDLALVAMAAEAELGVDVERVAAAPDLRDVAHAFLDPSEAESLARLPRSARTEAFFRRWTRREAYVKAVGTGLGTAPTSAPSGEWSSYSLRPAPGFVGALVVHGRGWRVTERVASLDPGPTPGSPAVHECG